MTIHDGHRSRMRERFRRDGLDGFASHEVLELLLFYGRARGDVNPIAHALIEAFGSIKGVLEARPEQLMAVGGVGEESATLIGLMLPLFRRYSASVCEEKPKILDYEQAEGYCKAFLAGYREERFYAVCLSAAGDVLGRRLIASGSLAEVQSYPRLVAEAALTHNAHSMVVCHNHPSGRTEPSRSDVDATIRLQMMLESMGVTLMDHVIVAGEKTYSFAAHGKLPMAIAPGGRTRRKKKVEVKP